MRSRQHVLSDPRPRYRTGVKRERRLTVEILESRMCLSLAVPAYSSLPGANHTIYLDFDGHVTSGTTWNTGYYGEDPINSPAWSLDSDRANFSDTELATIQRIWLRVAEDYSPFNVNVTTVEPPVNDLRKGEVSGDTKWGVRAVVTIETTTIRCGCGGIAYVGSFNDLYDEPVFIYNSSESGVAEAISHETGHSLYLAHDGTLGTDGVAGTSDDVEYYSGHGSGNTSWAPIMGSSYNRSVTTWDRGEYYNTNNGGSNANYGYGPDDLNIISTKNGFGYRNDDHGGTITTATPLVVAGTAISGSGIVATRTDVDVFSFTTGAGAVALTVNPATLRPNLDIKADLLDAAGNLVASSNPLDALNASFSLNLAAGTYFVRVDGVGVGNPASSTPTGYTDYDSLGQFSISGNIVDPGTLPTLSVDDVTVSESAGTASFVVRLNGSITQNATVTFATADGSAVAGSDYTATTGTLTFTPGGAATQTVTVPILNDAVSEPTDVFNLLLSNASTNSLIGDGLGAGSITNDDALLTVSDTSVTEANVSKRGVVSYSTAIVSVSLAQPVNRAVTVTYATSSSGYTATSGVDYQATTGTLVIPAGQTSASIPVTIIGDNTAEANETFAVIITSTDSIADNTGVVTIVDNDSGGGGGNGGGKPGPAGANYEGDYTIIDHVDLAEVSGSEITGDLHDHHDHDVLDHELDDDFGIDDDNDDGSPRFSGGNLSSILPAGIFGAFRQSFVSETKNQSLRAELRLNSSLDSPGDLLLRLTLETSDSVDVESTLSPDRLRKARASRQSEQDYAAASADSLLANFTDWMKQ